MASSNSKSNITPEKQIQSSISPSRRFYNSSTVSSSSSSSSAFASSMARSLTPNRSTSIDRHGYISSSPSVSSYIDNRNNNASSSPGRNSIASSSNRERIQTSSNHRNSNKSWSNGQKKTCMCSPTTHPGSFRCSLHRNGNQINNPVSNSYHSHRSSYGNRRSATTNSLMRIRSEGDLVKRYLASLIRPSSNHQKRPVDFQPKPSRLSVMSKSDE